MSVLWWAAKTIYHEMGWRGFLTTATIPWLYGAACITLSAPARMLGLRRAHAWLWEHDHAWMLPNRRHPNYGK